jgi:acetyl esterase/lipase
MRFAVLIVAVAGAPGWALARNYASISGPFAVTTSMGVPYVSAAAPASAQAADLLDACTPTSGPSAPPYPGLIIVHGGDWIGGSRDGASGNLALCQYWASWGFSAVTIDYRLINAADPTTYWPAQVFDIQAAVRWMRANSAALNLNPTQIIASGDSAGGQLVEYLGYQPYTIGITAGGNPAYGEIADEVTTENSFLSPQVQAIIAEFGPTSAEFGPVMTQDGYTPLQYSWTPLNVTPPQQTSVLALYWLEQSSSASPVGGVAPWSADTLLVQGNSDVTVLPLQSQALYMMLGDYNRPRNYYNFAGGHEFTGPLNGGIGDLFWTIRQAEVSFGYAHCHYMGCIPAGQSGPVDQNGNAVAFRN